MIKARYNNRGNTTTEVVDPTFNDYRFKSTNVSRKEMFKRIKRREKKELESK